MRSLAFPNRLSASLRDPTLRASALTTMFVLAACRGDGGAAETNADELGTDDQGDLDAEVGESAESGSNSDTNSTTADDGPTTDSTADSSSDTNDDSSNDDNDDEQPKFDTLVVPDGGQANCGGDGMDDPEFSYIWIANSGEGTITKLNTVTMVEEGRYRTRGDNAGSPSRTSVNLTGDVAVANRSSGITKVMALHENCDEMLNGQAGLQTSPGSADVLAWGQDDCVAWHTPLPGYTTNRPAAWTSGVINPNTCEVEEQFLWTSAATNAAGSLHVFRLDGVDGTIDADIPMPEISVGSFGAYGGAVNSENDFWFITYSNPAVLVRVDYETLEYDIYNTPPSICNYGFTVDSLDRPWIGAFCDGSAVFDPETEQFTIMPGMLGYGLQEDDQGVMWLGTYSPPGLRGIDIETLQETKWILLPNNASARGVSVDFFGYVWFVSMANAAYRVDTAAETWEVYSGLNGPYTYSDMTGHGLKIVSGGIPQG